MILSSLIEQYGANPFVIDCHDIELHEQGGQNSLIFKGPGSLESDSSGKISYKLHNQIPFDSDKIPILKRIAPYCKDKPLVAIVNACDYQGTKWGGGFTVPRMSMFDLGPSQQFMVYGEFSQLTVRIEKITKIQSMI